MGHPIEASKLETGVYVVLGMRLWWAVSSSSSSSSSMYVELFAAFFTQESGQKSTGGVPTPYARV